MKSSVIAAIAAAPLLLVTACGDRAADAASGTATRPTGPVEAAASGIVEEVQSQAAGRPIPREGLPDYVETAPGGFYLTSMHANNDLRTTGMLLYGATATAAELTAFHRASMERQGLTPGEAVTRSVRDHMETSFEGVSADGRSTLSVIVIDRSEPDVVVQMNYADERQ